MLNALLIQLFGREVTDRLAEAGFDTTDTIAASGAAVVAEKAGIPPSLARRIVAVAVEAGGPPAEPSPAEPEVPARPERHVRRPFRRPHSALAAPVPTHDGEEAAARSDVGEVDSANRGDAFIDDASLISWMGVASRAGRSSGMSIAVSDEILKPGLRHTKDTTAAPERSPASAQAKPGGASPPAARSRAAGERPAGQPFLVPESFWSFGARRDRPGPRHGQCADAPVDEKDAGSATPTSPRRRSHDDH